MMQICEKGVLVFLLGFVLVVFMLQYSKGVSCYWLLSPSHLQLLD